METKVIKVELSAHAHATEDVNKVVKAMLNLLPPNLRREVEVRKEPLQGHYSNPIIRITIVVEGERAVSVVKHLGSVLDDYDKEIIEASLASRYDRKTGRVFIRFSKQDAYLGRIRVAEGDDVIRMVITVQGTPDVKVVGEALKALGLLP